jgi:AraC-like DNA-binding protein
VLSGEANRIAEAIDRLWRNFARPLRIEDLARELGMSVSGFHHHFKAVTAMSPPQFQKQLRLQEARRLMVGERLDAATAGYRVGDDDPAYFCREYKRLFGAPPMRDVQRLRGGRHGGARAPASEPIGEWSTRPDYASCGSRIGEGAGAEQGIEAAGPGNPTP